MVLNLLLPESLWNCCLEIQIEDVRDQVGRFFMDDWRQHVCGDQHNFTKLNIAEEALRLDRKSLRELLVRLSLLAIIFSFSVF